MKIPQTKLYSIYKNLVLQDERSSKLDFNPDGREHYVYRVTDYTRTEKRHYYGSHTLSKGKKYKTLIDEFWTYRTSSKYNILNEDSKENYKVKIIKVFNNPADKMIYESYLHQNIDVKLHSSFWNESNQTPFGFDRSGINPWNKGLINPYTDDTIRRMKYSKEINPFIMSDSQKEYLSYINLGSRNGFYGKTHTEETKRKWNRKGTQTKAINHNAKKINIYNLEGQLEFECIGNFIDVCKENGLPARLAWSYRNGGTPIYSDIRNSAISFLKNKGLYIFKGWYALILD